MLTLSSLWLFFYINIMSSNTKTVYLIRHAESEENRRLQTLKRSVRGLSRWQLPTSRDIYTSLELLNVAAQVDSAVSEIGKQQIAYMREQLASTQFMKQVDLVAHSPLLRAKETCLGMLDLESSKESNNNNNNKANVIELDLLLEKTPSEWIPGNSASLFKRMQQLEGWVAEQTAQTIVLVGHSQFFKNMLKLDYKFKNCDVYKVQFDGSKWLNLEPHVLCEFTPLNANETTTATSTTDSS